MNSVERVKQLCKEKKISLHKLEKDLGFGNGYIGQLKKGKLPDDRLYKIAEYLGVEPSYLSTGINTDVSKSAFAELMYTMISEDLDSVLPSDQEYQLLSLYRKASEKDKRLVQAILNEYKEE